MSNSAEGLSEIAGERSDAIPKIDDDFYVSVLESWNPRDVDRRLLGDRTYLEDARRYFDALKSLENLELDSGAMACIEEELQRKEQGLEEFWTEQVGAINELLETKPGIITLRINGDMYAVERVAEVDSRILPVILGDAIVNISDIERVSQR